MVASQATPEKPLKTPTICRFALLCANLGVFSASPVVAGELLGKISDQDIPSVQPSLQIDEGSDKVIYRELCSGENEPPTPCPDNRPAIEDVVEPFKPQPQQPATTPDLTADKSKHGASHRSANTSKKTTHKKSKAKTAKASTGIKAKKPHK